MGNIAKRKEMTKLVLDTMKLIDPSGHNFNFWKQRLDGFSDKDFDYFMNVLREDRDCIYVETPNGKVTLQIEDIFKAAEFVGAELFHHLEIKDPQTGVVFITPEKYQIVELPERRLQQTIYEKLSVPVSDRKIDGLTGQVTGNDRSSSLTLPEIQGLDSQGLGRSLEELIVGRGGNISAYAAMKQSIEETGEARLDEVIDPESVSRSTAVLSTYLLAMGYESNLLDKGE